MLEVAGLTCTSQGLFSKVFQRGWSIGGVLEPAESSAVAERAE